MNDQLAAAADIIQTIKYAVIATADANGQPWNSPVRAVHDADLNFYWFSDKNSQHSRNLRTNAEVFLVIVDTTVEEAHAKGIYIQAIAHEVTDPEVIHTARELKKPGADDANDFIGDAVRRVYQAVPRRVWTNAAEIDHQKFIRDYRIELPLDDLRLHIQ